MAITIKKGNSTGSFTVSNSVTGEIARYTLGNFKFIESNGVCDLADRLTDERLFDNLNATEIINGDTGLAFADFAALDNYIDTNLFICCGEGASVLSTPIVMVGTPGNSNIPLSITAIPNALQYVWERATNALFTTGVTEIHRGPETSYNDTGLPNNTQRWYRVKATANGEGYLNSPWSAIVSGTTSGSPTIAKPTLIIGTPTPDTIPLSWAFETGATKATIRRSLNPDMTGATTLSTDNTATSYNATGLTANQTYYFGLVQSGPGYSNSPEDIVAATTAAGIVLVPLTAVDKYGSPVQVGNTYSRSSTPDSYEYISSNKQLLPDFQPFIVQVDITNEYPTFSNAHIGVNDFDGQINEAIAYIYFNHTAANKGKVGGQNRNTIYFQSPEITLTGTNLMRVRGDGSIIHWEMNLNGAGWETVPDSPTNIAQVAGLYVVGALYPFATGIDRISNLQVYPDVNGFTPPEPDPTGLTTQELRYENIQQAKSSLKYSDFATAAGNGDSVGVILDKKGYLPLVYAGIASPTIMKAPPRLIDTIWLEFNNEPHVNYDSMVFSANTPPFEVVVVSRELPGQLFEAKMENGPNGAYLGNLGSDTRVFDQNGIMVGSGVPEKYKPVIERLAITTAGIDYWRNNVKKGTFSFSGLSSGEIAASTTKTIHSIGTFTNCMDFDFASLYYKDGTSFTDSDWTTNIYPELATKWNVGILPNEILLSNIGWTRSGTTYTPVATVINTPAGITVADPSSWDYEWYWGSDQHGLGDQTKFATTYQVNQSQFPNNGGPEGQTNVSIKVRMRPKNTLGATWRFLSGVYVDYTQANG